MWVWYEEDIEENSHCGMFFSLYRAGQSDIAEWYFSDGVHGEAVVALAGEKMCVYNPGLWSREWGRGKGILLRGSA
jgi:hypothetical protein